MKKTAPKSTKMKKVLKELGKKVADKPVKKGMKNGY